MKILKRKILFVLAAEIDFFNVGEGFEFKAYQYIYERLLNYKHSSIRDAVLQLVLSGEIDKIVRDAVPFFRLTSRGRHRLLSFFTQSWGQRKVWDRIWRIAIINSQTQKLKSSRNRKNEKKDNQKTASALRKLRRELKSLGFKKLANAVYISPLPISEKIQEYSLENSIFSENIAVIESRKLLIGDNEQIANRIWKLEDIYEEYTNIITRIDKLLKKINSKKTLKKQVKNDFSQIINQFFEILEKDPGLPKKILPKDWPADKLKAKFLNLANAVIKKK